MSGQWEPVPSAHLATVSLPPRRPLSSDCLAARNGTPAAQWTRSASRRWWVNGWRFGRAVTTARCHWSSPFHRTGRGRKQRASCCGSGNELTSGVRSPTRSERRSTSSGRKNISGHGETRTRQPREQAPPWRRVSNSATASSVACSLENRDDESQHHGVLVHGLTVVPRGERVSFVSRDRLHGQERRGGCQRPRRVDLEDGADGCSGDYGG